MTTIPLSAREEWLASLRPKEPFIPKVGIEVELGAINSQSGKSLPYGGARGTRAMLEAIREDDDWTPIREGENILGLTRKDGALVTLEHGGAVEYSSVPMRSVSGLVRNTRHDLMRIARLVEPYGALLASGNTPFDTRKDSALVPKTRAKIMEKYCEGLGANGADAWRIMMQSLSIQVTLDFSSENDMSRKMCAIVPAAPVSTALFANSPIQDGVVNGVLSHRAKNWLRFDPRRCGVLPVAMKESMTFDDYLDWLLEVPMMFSAEGGQYRPVHGQTFRKAWQGGTETLPPRSASLWKTHLSALFTDVRLRNTIEVRAMDGQAFEDISAVPAFWAGIIYYQPSLDAVWRLFRSKTKTEADNASRDVCEHGLSAKYGNDAVGELAGEMLNLARLGLNAMIDEGIEPPETMGYLDPLQEIVDSRVTRAERMVQRWNEEFKQSPQKFVQRYQVPTYL